MILDWHYSGQYDFDQTASMLESFADVEDGWKTLDKVYQKRERQKQRKERQQALYENNVIKYHRRVMML